MKIHTHTTRSLLSALCLLTSALCPLAHAQQVLQSGTLATTATTAIPVVTTPAATATGTTTAEEVVQMDVFNVDASKNEGYQAFNTTSGSRINTPLKDTAASISPFTDEFLSDVGAASIEELLTYAGNMEPDSDDANGSFDDSAGIRAGNTDNNFRIRGISAGVSVNYVETGVPQDLYNISAAEIASGANSNLFGSGPQGGLLTLTTKRANLNRNTTRVQGVLGTWFNPGKAWNYKRLTLDYNVVLMPRTWALRLLGVFQDGGTQSWRYWQGYHQKRLNPVMSIKPWKNTTISLEYEKGNVTQAATRSLNLADGFTGWLYWHDQQAAAGNPNPGVLQGFGSTYAPPPIPVTDPATGATYNMNPVTQINSGGANPYFVYVNNNDTLYDYRQSYRSASLPSSNPSNWALPSHTSSYYYSTTGPNAVKTQDFQRWSANIEQRIGRFNFQLSYNHNKTIATSHSPNATTTALRADPNSSVSSYIWGGSSTANLLPGPNPGGLYVEDVWMLSQANQTNNSYRLTSETSFNLKNFGRHRIVGLLERNEQERTADRKNEILVDANQVPISELTVPNGVSNWVYRRNYLTPGDFRTYHSGDWDPLINDLTIGSRTFHSAYISVGQNISHVTRKTNSGSLNLQSYWFRNSLVTTLGARYDDYSYGKELSARISDPNDPRILNKTKVLNEWGLNGQWNRRQYGTWAYNAGAVWHITNRLSTFANYSTNRGAPYLDGRTILPNGAIPPLSRGVNAEYGVRFDITGDGKWTLRLTHFITKQLDDAPVAPNTIQNPNSTALGSSNLFNIYDALYFLESTSQTGVPSDPAHAGAGPMTAEQYAIMPPTTRFPYGSPPQYNAGTVNVRSQGYELELTANPTRNIDLRATFSYTTRNRINIFPEIFAYYNANIPIWLDMANPATHPNPKSPDHTYYVNTGGGAMQPLYDYIWDQLYASGGVRDGINTQLFNESGPLGARPFKFNITGKYKFLNGSLKGLAAGGSVQYWAPNFMPDPKLVRQTIDMPPPGTTDLALDPDIYFGRRGMMKGRSQTFCNVFFTYRCKLSFMGINTNATFQLNINNILNNDIVTEARRGANLQLTRVYINPPRSIRLTTTFEF